MSKQYAVIGLGRFGTSVARTLYDLGQEVLAIDIVEERLKNVANEVTHTLMADTTDAMALKDTGIDNFDVAIVAIGENVQANIMTTMLLKEAGVKYVVAKALNRMHGLVLEKIGADRVIFPERDMGKRVAHNLVNANLVDFIELVEGFRIIKVAALKEMIGLTLQDLNFRAKYGVNILLIKRTSGETLIFPGSQDLIQDGDILVMAGEKTAVNKFEQKLEKEDR